MFIIYTGTIFYQRIIDKLHVILITSLNKWVLEERFIFNMFNSAPICCLRCNVLNVHDVRVSRCDHITQPLYGLCESDLKFICIFRKVRLWSKITVCCASPHSLRAVNNNLARCSYCWYNAIVNSWWARPTTCCHVWYHRGLSWACLTMLFRAGLRMAGCSHLYRAIPSCHAWAWPSTWFMAGHSYRLNRCFHLYRMMLSCFTLGVSHHVALGRSDGGPGVFPLTMRCYRVYPGRDLKTVCEQLKSNV